MSRPFTIFFLAVIAACMMLNPALAEVAGKAGNANQGNAKEGVAGEADPAADFGWFEPVSSGDSKDDTGEIHLRDGVVIRFVDFAAPDVAVLGAVGGKQRVVRFRNQGKNKIKPYREIIFVDKKDYAPGYNDTLGRHIPAQPGTLKIIKRNGKEFLIEGALLQAQGGGAPGTISYTVYNPAGKDYREASQNIIDVNKIVFYE